jgi:hypothetical protein
MPTRRNKTLYAYRRRLNRQGIVRLEMNVRRDDAILIRRLIRALNDPEGRFGVRNVLQGRFGDARSKGLKALLAVAPLEGVDLSRDCDDRRAT